MSFHVQAVVRVYLDYFVNGSPNELVEGGYTIFGKVVRMVSEGETYILEEVEQQCDFDWPCDQDP